MLRRYSTIKPSRGTQILPKLRIEVLQADQGCAGPKVGMPGDCFGGLELDHVRASHGMGMKSETSRRNLTALCSTHHRLKTNAGRTWRPRLLQWIEKRDAA